MTLNQTMLCSYQKQERKTFHLSLQIQPMYYYKYTPTLVSYSETRENKTYLLPGLCKDTHCPYICFNMFSQLKCNSENAQVGPL